MFCYNYKKKIFVFSLDTFSFVRFNKSHFIYACKNTYLISFNYVRDLFLFLLWLIT